MKSLKVWNGRYMSLEYGNRNNMQTKCIVAGYTKKQACELSGISYSEITNYFGLTGNDRQLSIATEPGFWLYDIRDFNEYDESCPIVRIK
jgi:hypothetical protein